MSVPLPFNNWKQRLLAAAIAAITAALTTFFSQNSDPAPTPPPAPQEKTSANPPRFFGWVNDPDAVKSVCTELNHPHFRDTEAFQSTYDGPEDVFLWDACRKVTGDLLPPRNQGQVGSCVSFGTASAIEHLLCVQIATGAGEEYRDLVQEIIYGGSRVEIGGGKIRGDGSVGAWAAKFVSQYGVLPRGVFGTRNLTAYSENRCREYGRSGVPDELEPLVKQHPVKSVANVRSWDECQAAIRNGYPIAVCSDKGFTMQRDSDGFCSPKGVWQHCMAIVGIRSGKRPGAFILNSWGPNAHTGPRGLGDPSPAGFWADAKVVDRMLKQGDSWAFSHAVGFPARKLNWYADHNRANDSQRLKARAALALAFARPAMPTYEERYSEALKTGKPLIVFVGQPAKEVRGALSVKHEVPDVNGPAVLIGVPAGERFQRIDLRGRPNEDAILAAIRNAKKPSNQTTTSFYCPTCR